MGGPDDDQNFAQDPHSDDGAATRHSEVPSQGSGGDDLSSAVAPKPEGTSGGSADVSADERTDGSTEVSADERADGGTEVSTDERADGGTEVSTDESTESTAEVMVVAEQEQRSSPADEAVSATIQSPGNEVEAEVLVVAEAVPAVEPTVFTQQLEPSGPLPLAIAEAEDGSTKAPGEATRQEASAPLAVIEDASSSGPMVVTETMPPVEDASSSQEEPKSPLEGTASVEALTSEDGKADQPAVPPAVGDVADGQVHPPQGTTRAPSDPGKVVEGVVTAVDDDGVELTLDDGRPAYISRRNFGLNDESPKTVLSVGDRAYGAELRREDPKSRVVLSRTWALKKQAWDKVVDASTEGKMVTGRVVSGNKKGVVIDAGVRGFVPMSHFELEPVADMAPFIGQSLEFKVIEIDAQKEKLVLSRRSILLKEQRKQTQEFINGIKPGEVRSGKISSFADYGAFVDLGGVNGLAHISEISWDRVGKPSDVLTIGQQVEVKVLDVKAKKKRISLSIRQTTDDPLSGFEVGTVLSGPVTRLVDFGAFVLVDGFEGLVHLSELAEYRVSAPEEIVTPGDVVGVKVLSIDPKRRRLELSIRQAAEYQG